MKFTKLASIAALSGSIVLLGACADQVVRPGASHQHELRSMAQTIEQAKTPADHLSIALRYEQEADRLLRMAQSHEAMAQTYEKTDNPKLINNARHCRRIAQHLRTVAEEMKTLAQTHRQMAGQ